MNHPLFRVALILFLVSGCAGTKMYSGSSSSQATDPNTAQIHLKRLSGALGGPNALLIADAGDGLEYNAVMAVGPGIDVYYIGPWKGQKGPYGEKPIMGDSQALCGFASENTELLSDGTLTGAFDYICPEKEGIYEVFSPWAFKVFGPRSFTHDYKYGGGVTQKVTNIKYEFIQVSIIGEVANGDSITWSRPEGKLHLFAINCLVSCGDEDMVWTKVPLTKSLKAGEDYYIQVEYVIDGVFEISDQPFE